MCPVSIQSVSLLSITVIKAVHAIVSFFSFFFCTKIYQTSFLSIKPEDNQSEIYTKVRTDIVYITVLHVLPTFTQT